MKEIISNLDIVGHALGIGGFEGVMGAFVLALAALVVVVRSFSLLTRAGTATYQNDGQRVSPLEWMEEAEKTVGADQRSKGLDPSWDMLPDNIWHKRP
ncbi:MAG: hypothetical protein HXX11_23605 [Desulfuromonadales bacterium]|nr:hypothetical protein [Desulfuromonadales bacterium]